MKKNDTAAYVITVTILVVGLGAAWLITTLASGNTVSKFGGSEAEYSQLQQSILE